MVMLDLVLKMQIKVNFLLHVVMMVVILFHVYRFIGLLSASKFQWGYIYLNPSNTINFPISFNTYYSITTGNQRVSNNGFVQITGHNVNSISFKFEWDTGQNKSGHCWWLITGK